MSNNEINIHSMAKRQRTPWEQVKQVIRIIIIPAYILLYFTGAIGWNTSGHLVNAVVIFIGMVAFVRRKLSWKSYAGAIGFLAFYFILYGTPALDSVAGVIGLPDKWFVYGLIYTILVLSFGIRFIFKKKKDRYQVIRTIVVMVVQLFIAFLIPLVMNKLTMKEYYFSYLWPLEMKGFYPQEMLQFPTWIYYFSIIGSLVVVPLLALLFGKRFYCSWICGCGGLAETLGDPWRQLSDKSKAAWKFEKVSIHTTLVFAVITTILVVADYFINNEASKALLANPQMAPKDFAVMLVNPSFHSMANRIKDFYGFVVKTGFAGILGVAAYPLLGSRAWCRFFCPMAAMIGLIQKAGRFHIKVKKDMCISCGNCSTYCEMGIDVRAYAQKNQSFTRASCVGCGLCANVCPRGVLRLENKKTKATVI